MKIELYNYSGSLKKIISTTASSTLNQELMREDTISASWIDVEYYTLEVGDYIEFAGSKYKIHKPYCPQKSSEQEYKYNTTFYGYLHDAEQVMFLHLTDGQYSSEFSLDDSPRHHLQKWVDNMNRIAGSELWSVGTVLNAPNKNIVYTNLKCYAAGMAMAQAYETEFWADGYTINLCKCERGTSVQLAYGQGLTSLVQSEGSSNQLFFTRLFPLGSTRNIDATKYGHRRLQLPDGQKYVDYNTHLGLFEHVEESVFAEIYPKYIGTVSSVRTEVKKGEDGKNFTVYFFKDNAMEFDPNTYEIAGMVKRVSFISGDLNGRGQGDGEYYFEANFHSGTKEWEIINIYPDYYDGYQIPGNNIIPRVGDRYFPHNFRMPDIYIRAAEREYADAVNKYIRKYSEDTSVYEGKTDYLYISKKGISLQVGSRVRLLSPEYFSGYRDTRITRLVRKLDEPADATISCSAQVSQGWKRTIESSISTLRYILNRQVEDAGVDILKTGDERKVTEHNVLSALRTLHEIAERALSRKDDDTAAGIVTFLQGLKIGEFLQGVQGGRISEMGDAELRNLVLRIKAVIPILEATTTTTNSLEASTVRATEITNKSKITTLNLLVQALAEMHSLTVADTARIMRGVIRDTLSSESFASGFAGNGFRIYKEAVTGDWNLEIDNVIVRKLFHVFEIRVQRITHQGGMIIKSPAGGKITKVEDKGNYWRIEHDGLDDFATNDLVLCQAFKFIGDGGRVKRYWRAVWTTGKGFAHISKNDCEAGSADPEVGDEIVTFGNKTNPDRQSAQIDCVIGENAPYRASYAGINSYSLVGKEFERTGNLLGVVDEDFGALSGPGVYTNRAYIKGQLRVMSGKTVEEHTLSAIENIELGGRNLIKKSQEVVSATHIFQLSKSWLNLKGKTVVLSFEYEYNNVSTGTTYSQMRFGVERNLTMPGGTFYARAWVDLPASSTGLSGKGRCVKILTLPAAFTVAQDKDLGAYVQVLGGNVRMWNFKLEEGNKATAWTPAPEDFTDEISTVRSDFEVREGIISAKVQEAKTAAQQAQNNATAVQQTATQVEIKATQAQQSATQANATLQQVNAKAAIITAQAGQIDLKVQETTTKASEAAKAAIIATAMSKGKRLNPDVAFRKGVNGLSAYDNKRSGLVKLERVASAEGNPSASTHMLKITTRYGEKVNNQPPYAPGYGGFYFGTQTRANAVFLARFIAKIPDKFLLQHNTNPTGTGAKARWLTSQLGTGKWEEYAILLECGSSGTFSTTFFFALYNRISNSTHPDTDPSPDNPITWYVSSATVYDCTDADADWQAEINARPTTEEIKSNITLTPDKISVFGKLLSLVGMVTFNAFDAATQSKITALSDEVARSLGYASAQDAISQTAAGKTIISGGYLNTELLKANAIEAKHIAAEAITADKIKAKSLTSAQINVKELWAKILQAEEVIAQTLKSGASATAPNGYNTYIDALGNGHLGGGKIKILKNKVGVGVFNIEDDKEIYITDPDGRRFFQYCDTSVPSLNYITDKGVFNGTFSDRNFSVPVTGQYGGYYERPNSVGQFDLPLPYGHRYDISGEATFANVFTLTKNETLLKFRLEPVAPNSVVFNQGSVTITLLLNNQAVSSRKYMYFAVADDEGVEMSFSQLQAGTYSVKVEVQQEIYLQVEQSFFTPVDISTKTWKWEAGSGNYRLISYHRDGMFVSYPHSTLYQSVEEGLVVKGKADLPGAICGARIDANRSAVYYYGKRAIEQGGTSVRVDRSTTGVYRVHHSIGHTKYIPMVTPKGGGMLFVEMLDVANNYFEFKLYNRDGNAASSAFNYHCMGEND